VVGGTPRLVELHPSCFASRIEQARDKARAPHTDLPSGEVASDRGQLILLAHPFLVPRDAKRPKAADYDEEYRNGPHR
jgi:hypothetical protein